MSFKTYEELIQIPDFIERYRYLRQGCHVAVETFGRNRYLNQLFYHSPEWKWTREQVILRDSACDLAFPGLDIRGPIHVHHIEPITEADILNRTAKLFDMNNLITVSFKTHQAITYGDESLLPICFVVERTPFDTCPWRV